MDTLRIEPAAATDIPALAALWAEAFPGERTVDQRIRQLEAGGVYGGIETAWKAMRGNSIAGAFRAYAMHMHCDGARLPMMGLAAVAVSQSTRARGIGVELCRAAIHSARARGDVISVLYPFRPSYYAKLGWSLCGTLHAHDFQASSLAVTHPAPRVRESRDIEMLSVCYDNIAARSNGLIERNDRIWRSHLDWPDARSYVLVRDAVCAGYMITRTSGAALDVRELLAIDHDAYDEMLSWIALQRTASIRYDAVPAERFDLRLTEPRTPGAPVERVLYATVARVIRGPMARILDVAAALSMKQFDTAVNETVSITVRDGIVPENDATFVGMIADGRWTAVADGKAALSITTDIGTLTQIYLGEVSASEAVRLGRAVCTGDAEKLDRIFAVRTPYRLLDEF